MWRRLCPRSEFSCEVTLHCGQSFAWKKLQDQWIGVIGRHVIALKECPTTDAVHYMCLHPQGTTGEKAALDVDAHVRDYFRTETNLVKLYGGFDSLARQTECIVELWKAPNDKFSQAFVALPGLRTLRQDPVECLFSFICSSNNNISRIQQLVDKLRINYGDSLLKTQEAEWFAFPTVSQLKAIDESELRSLGFGYRAQFIVKSAEILHELGGPEYLEGLRAIPDPAEVQTALQQFAGVGRKVADCVALFSLDKLEAIPVDTHVWQIACRDFRFNKAASKSLTPTVYAAVGKLYQDRFTPYAGWAHSILFAADLVHFKALVAPKDASKTPSKKAKSAAATKKSKAKAVDEQIDPKDETPTPSRPKRRRTKSS
ncbi:hypothetical protein AeMF1_000569 [Aphanomyces euteiches]|nr:hypothetical protein AeMF1_000569 [Aphanomyces euteiches]KAH9194757.1 hypothetical protein AeNC1_003274 [Aphanomyces euteiches]